jgi:peptide/nickel transport system substrate-binding protein
MNRALKLIVAVAVLTMVAVACGGGDEGGGGGSASPTQQAELQKGGTLEVESDDDVFLGFDPQTEYYQMSFLIFRCCLQRTLLSYNGQDVDHQGNELFPDLATDLPEVSDDQLTWTFHMKQGLHYAPPLQDVEITSHDIVRALIRTATPEVGASYGFYYSVIEGFDDYSAGKADTITGLETPDDYTLVVHLTQPTGHLGFMFAMPTTGPIPPNPDNPDAVLGIADGHDTDFGHYVVASGPYMWEGTENLDFSLPPKDQPQVTGWVPNKLQYLVRNPSWDETTDDLRPAYVDAIRVSISPGAAQEVLEKKVIANEADVVMENGISPSILRQFNTDATLQNRIFINPSPSNYFYTMNMGLPPFDDLHVRRAVQYAIDKAGLLRVSGGSATGYVANHYVPDVLLTTSDGTQLLEDYDPFPSTDGLGADSPDGLEAAKAEMAQSKYDTNQDGLCDAPECKDVLTLGSNDPSAAAGHALTEQNMEAIGITLDLKELSGSAVYTKVIAPANQIPFALSAGWVMDWPDAFTFFYFPAYGPSILDNGNSNYSMIGATPEQMKKYGYSITDVPSMDDKIDACVPLTGDERVTCWADVDKYLMEDIAGMIPYVFSNTIQIISDRVENFTYSGFDSQMAYEQVALAGGGA